VAVIGGRMLAGGAAPELSTAAPLAGMVRPVGALLLTEYVVAVQLAGVLLLAAMVGAIAIAKRQPMLDETQETD
jgi:NADH:ubiquinone oxidoreductase subunit 6 (subunit J)